jgi:myo-inositol-1(or 4)-monophosphatase
MAAFNLDETLQFAIDLAHSAGAIILDGARKREQMDDVDWDAILKKNTADLVTETDQATERHVKEKIAERFPDHE